MMYGVKWQKHQELIDGTKLQSLGKDIPHPLILIVLNKLIQFKKFQLKKIQILNYYLHIQTNI